MNKIRQKDVSLLLFFAILLAMFFSNSFRFSFLQSKYFYDYDKTLSLVLGLEIASDDSFDFAANFFRTINILNLRTILSWSIFLCFINVWVIIFFYRKNPFYSFFSYVFFFSSIFISCIYIFNIGKEMIQFILFALLLFLIIKFQNKFLLFFAINAIFLFEGLYFRSYYLIVVLIFDLFYFYFIWFKKCKHKILKISIFIIIGLFAVQVFLPVQFNILINIRQWLNANSGADASDRITAINDLIPSDNNVILFIINYLINLFRICFPFELLIKGNLLYYSFFVFQLFNIVIIIKCLFNYEQSSFKEKVVLLIIVSYYLVLVLFEPDFGSLVRHENAISLLIFYMLNDSERKSFKKIINFELNKRRSI